MNLTEAIAKLSALIAANPYNVNPVEHNEMQTCLYTGYDGESHCIVGQLGTDEGWNIPGPGEPGDYANDMDEWGWPIGQDTADYLAAVQLIADGPLGGPPIPWGAIVLPDPVEVKRTADAKRETEREDFGY